MSKCYAVQHIGIGVKRYKPGEELPELTDEQWKRLSEAGAIRTEYDSVEAALEMADEEANAQTSAHFNGEGTQDAAEGDKTAAKATEPDDDEEEMPEIDVMAGIAEEEDAPKKRTTRKKEKA